jgi:glycosyltransferase involved in cell wall biosynthesis
VRILLVSQFFPSAADPDLGVFVRQVADGLAERGHTVDRAVVDHRGAGRAGDARLLRDALRRARRRPDVVFGHFLAPAGVSAAAASVAARAPLVVMAHGQDVQNAVALPPIRLLTRAVVAHADTVIFNSDWLRRRLPMQPRRHAIIDCGVDLDRFAVRDRDPREGLEPPVFLFVGALIARKNVVRLRDAFAQLGRGTLVVVGDGELRGELEGRERIRLVGRVEHDEVAGWMAAADVVCLPSEREPLGQVLLEALASGRSVVATDVGGPPEFVTPGSGAIVDPHDTGAIRAGLEHAASLPTPNPAARAAAEPHAIDRQVDRMEAVLRDAVQRRRAGG